MHTPGEWYTACTGNHQGLICSYTGENIAVAYDKKDAPIITAAPGLLRACVLAEGLISKRDSHTKADIAEVLGMLNRVICEVTE